MDTSYFSRNLRSNSRRRLGRCRWTHTDPNNRPVRFTNVGTSTSIDCGYDYMGRRFEKKVTVNGTITLHHRYLYRGYLQIVSLDAKRANMQDLWLIHWDPTQPTATRPLSIRKNGTWYTYGHDLTKNVMEIFNTGGGIATTYDYTPFGAVTTQGSFEQSLQWSSEIYDSELALTYYNYRHYNPMDGRWINRDPIGEEDSHNLYKYLVNNSLYKYDILGREGNNKDCCTIILFVDPPSLKAVKDNVLNVAIDTGHTWVELHEKGATSTFSVGPDGPIGKGSLDDFESGNLDGVTDFPIESHKANAVSREWKLTKEQCKKAKKIIQDKAKNGIKYTPNYQCTTSALELLNAIPVSPAPPKGEGPVIAKQYGISVWSGAIANPYHLSKALGATPASNETGGKKSDK